MAEGPIRAPDAAVAVAASAGGVEALRAFVGSLPGDFAGVFLVVLHIPEAGPSVLPHILARSSALRVAQATNCTLLEAGLVLVAPPGQHLRVADSHVVLDHGPRENGHRPSADVLFRSVSKAFGTRAAGVVLSGTMDDGAAGLRMIAERGGFAMVQTPGDAAFPGMPAAAIAEVQAARVRPAAAMGSELAAWAARMAARTKEREAQQVDADDAEISVFTCPECGGTLWAERPYGSERFRCRVGHSFSAHGLLAGKDDALEAALWAAIVALEERADVSRRLLGRLEGARPARLRRYEADIEQATQRIRLLRGVIDELARHPFSDDRAQGLDEGDVAGDGARGR